MRTKLHTPEQPLSQGGNQRNLKKYVKANKSKSNTTKLMVFTK
jgi:hypothetical protein